MEQRAELVKKLDKPRAVWLMLPQGEPTEDMVSQLGRLLDADDVIIESDDAARSDFRCARSGAWLDRTHSRPHGRR